MYLAELKEEFAHFSDRLLLSEHIFLAQSGASLIFLDLVEDSYFLIEPRYAAYISIRLGLDPTDGMSTIDASNISEAKQFLSQLMAVRILTEDIEQGKPATLLEQRAGIQELPRYGVDGPKFRLQHLAAFLKAFALAKGFLWFGGIERTVKRVAERRRRSSRGLAPQDLERAREFVEIYRKLRPLVMRRKDQCLLNSLVLIEFLAMVGLYPSWYFGVKLNGFIAHCWLQSEATVFNDDVENVSDYSIIMIA